MNNWILLESLEVACDSLSTSSCLAPVLSTGEGSRQKELRNQQDLSISGTWPASPKDVFLFFFFFFQTLWTNTHTHLQAAGSPNSILKPLFLHLSGLNIPCKGTISALPPVSYQSALKPWMQPQKNRELLCCAAGRTARGRSRGSQVVA